MPRVLPDGSRNGMHLLRLKDKLGNRANASAEVEYAGAVGWRLGDEGRGIATLLTMVTMTRLDCVLGSAGLIRIALSEAAHHVAHRSAFGARLADAPLMQAVVADLALESEAATALALRLAGAVDREERELLRLALPAAKYLVCKRAPTVVAEALECLGGDGYVEDSGLPRLYREAPLNSIWEGSGNVTALDVLRAITREPDSEEAVLAEIDAAAGADSWFDRGGAGAAHRAAGPGGAACAAAGGDAGAVPAGVAAAAVRAGRRGVGVRVVALPARRPVAHGGHAPGGGAHGDALERVTPSVVTGLGSGGRVTQGPEVHHSPSSASVSSPKGFTPGPAASAWATCTCRHLTRVGHAARGHLRAERLDRVALGEVRLVRAAVGRRRAPGPSSSRSVISRIRPSASSPPIRELSRAQVR